MIELKTQLIVHLYNQGGMPTFIQYANEQHIEAARRSGQITNEEADEHVQKVKDAARPVREQFQFRRKTTLPFVPYGDCLIRKGGFDFIANQVIWDEDKEQFELHMYKRINSECSEGQDQCDCTKALMADDSGWEMMPPEMPDDA